MRLKWHWNRSLVCCSRRIAFSIKKKRLFLCQLRQLDEYRRHNGINFESSPIVIVSSNQKYKKMRMRFICSFYAIKWRRGRIDNRWINIDSIFRFSEPQWVKFWKTRIYLRINAPKLGGKLGTFGASPWIMNMIIESMRPLHVRHQSQQQWWLPKYQNTCLFLIGPIPVVAFRANIYTHMQERTRLQANTASEQFFSVDILCSLFRIFFFGYCVWL